MQAAAKARSGCGTHVLVDEVKAAVTRHESGNLLAVFDQLGAHALADGGVRLLGLNADLLDNDALGVGGTWQRERDSLTKNSMKITRRYCGYHGCRLGKSQMRS